ncbi:MAG TPA: biotin/lipoyl-binding protein, partial [Streptosporangiaceae bacterium]|nr:biotin/lipoyl-binding protein [Streptosporangiaceae bacterium]
MKRRILWLLVVVVSAALMTGGYLYKQSLGGRSAFRTAPVTRGPLTAAISATGALNAVITVQVGSQVSGNIKALHADFNSVVKKGQVIARIDPEIFQAQVNQAKAQLDASRAAVLNQQAMVEKTRADLANARAALASAHANSAKAQVAVVDGRRNLTRQQELRQKELTAQSDLDAAQVQADSSVAQYDATVAQERAQAAAVTSAEAQL